MKRLAVWLALFVFVAYAVVSLLYVPRLALFGERSPITMSPADVGLAYEDITLAPQGEDLQLAAWWMPAQQATATLVFSHGGGSNRHTTYFHALEFYRAMVAEGVSVLALDLRNHGNSGDDGQGLQFGRTESADVLAALDWAREKHPQRPLFAMGISMGGATVIHAASRGAVMDGLILLDPLLDTHSGLAGGAWAESGLPPAIFAGAAWASTTFYGLPDEESGALSLARDLELPMLLIQDPDDPVTIAEHAQALARANDKVNLVLMPPVDSGHPELAWKARWGSHVAAFHMFPEETTGHIMAFMKTVAR